MSHLVSIFSDHTVHGVHDINRLRMLSAQKDRQRLDRFIQIYLSHGPGKVTTFVFLGENSLVIVQLCTTFLEATRK